MALLGDDVTRFDGAIRTTRRPVSWAEECMRNGVEAFLRQRRPAARIVHELVMDRGKVRADVCAIDIDHIVSVEIKSQYDVTERLINQAAMFRLATPELWLFCDERHERDCAILAYLMPSIGYATAGVNEIAKASNQGRAPVWQIRREAVTFRPDPEALLSLLWVAELTREAVAARVISPPGSKPWSHGQLVKRMLAAMTEAEIMVSVCAQLRRRNAEWRADPVRTDPDQDNGAL